MPWFDDSTEALVNPLVMIVLEILGQDMSQLLFGSEHQLVEAFHLDGSDESLGIGVEIRTSRRRFHRVHARGFEDGVELVRVPRVSRL
jgi:hypothetical protein